MSTYYNFYCTKCLKYQKDISFTRQAWGWGNADIIDTFRFLMKHTDTCGHENIRICSEHDEIIDLFEPGNNYTADTSDDLNEYFPHSNDWEEERHNEEYEKHKKYVQPGPKGAVLIDIRQDNEREVGMHKKIEFDYHSFEDYLFQAIQESRNLVSDEIWVDEVKRFLSLAMGEVDLFVKKIRESKKNDR